MAEHNHDNPLLLRVILDLHISPREATPEELKREIAKTLREVMGVGILPEDSPASIEDWNANVVELEDPQRYCTFCGLPYGPGAHVHQGGMVCEDCWDERLRSTE